MRIDHHAYQRATGVAAAGLFVQIAIALLLLVFGKTTGPAGADGASLSDSATVIASSWAFAGTIVWLGLVLLFHQHRLERLESLEFEAGPRVDDQGRLFATDEARVARRRLELMHSVLMPVLSLAYAALLVGFAWGVIWWFGAIQRADTDFGDFTVTAHPGWQLAVAFGAALVCFIFSRFVAGMALQKAWANLRGGAAVMVGNALVTAALGVGTVFRMLEEDPAKAGTVLHAVAWGLAVFMIAVAAETVLNFLLNLYRPRRPGEVPRPAFDSRVLSLFAAPDSIVRSINEAVNYQFGFDITSSWGYQLLLRNFVRLLSLGVVVVLALTTLVVVQPQEQALRLRFGSVVGDVYQGGPMAKMPWPIDEAVVMDVNRVRDLPLGVITPVTKNDVVVWGGEAVDPSANTNLFLVGASKRSTGVGSAGVGSTGRMSMLPGTPASGLPADSAADSAEEQATDQFALVEADIVLQYRVRDGQLPRYLGFTNDVRSRRDQSDMRERALKAIALREVTRVMSTRSLDEVLSPPFDAPFVDVLARGIQAAFDAAGCGVEVVGVSVPRLRPPGTEAGKFEELSIARQNSRRQLEAEQSTVSTALSMLVGDPVRAEQIVRGIGELSALERELSAKGGPAADEELADRVAALQARLEQMVIESRAQVASVISGARANRWNTLMDAQTIAQEVLGQSAAWNVDPALYRTRKTMQALGEALSLVRVKYILLPDKDRISVEIEMQEPTTGLNIGDYLESREE